MTPSVTLCTTYIQLRIWFLPLAVATLTWFCARGVLVSLQACVQGRRNEQPSECMRCYHTSSTLLLQMIAVDDSFPSSAVVAAVAQHFGPVTSFSVCHLPTCAPSSPQVAHPKLCALRSPL
jgi:hypothetical protein